MPSRASSRLLAVALAQALALTLAGCAGTEAPPSRGALGDTPTTAAADPGAGAPDAARATTPEVPDDAAMRRQVQQLLDRRARAVRDRDERAFVAQLGDDERLRERQLRWFRNVVQLPWQRLDYEVLDTDWDVEAPARWGRQVLVPTVVQRTRLSGFDNRDVQRDLGLAVSFDGDRPRIVADRTPSGEPMFRGTPAPWDLVAVQVRRAPGVLGVFDRGGLAAAPEVMRAASDGLRAVDRQVPFRWARDVVVYHVTDPEVTDTFTDVPGGSIELLGALTFPTYSRPELSPAASSRMLVMPSSVAAGDPFLSRIVRHELVHVALGERDDGAPTWLSEGMAEYLAASALAPDRREIPTVAVQRAQERPRGMPRSSSFNGPDQDWHYALSWMALDQVAESRGRDALWSLLEAFAASPVGPDDEGQDRVLRAELGYDGAELARRAAARIRTLYR